MHGYRYPAHEETIARLAQEAGFDDIAVSHIVSPRPKFVARGWTTVADAYLTPPLSNYISDLQTAFGETPLRFMKSDGGLTGVEAFSGKDAILSGPAGGVVGMARAGVAAGFDKLVGFDMGGTSTDVSLYDGALERAFETDVEGFKLQTPTVRVHTVAAGGGSVLAFEDGRCKAGPHSAGAKPGPAAYGKGGPATVTDANIALGRIDPAHTPHVFGPNANAPLDAGAARAALAPLAAEMGLSVEAAAEGFLTVAVENMAEAIKHISVSRGLDARDYALVSFGGAGGQHACRVADALQMKTVLIHPFASLLSAYGIGLAEVSELLEAPIEAPLSPDSLKQAEAEQARLAEEALARLTVRGVAREEARVKPHLALRYANADAVIALPPGGALETAFAEEHARRYGYASPGRAIIIDAVRIEAGGAETPPPALTAPVREAGRPPSPNAETRLFLQDAWQAAPVYNRDSLCADDSINGPALIAADETSIIVEDGWRAKVTAENTLVLTRATPLAVETASTGVDPVRLEVFNRLFMSIAEQMGAALERTAASVNIKERKDFSCALFDAGGGLVSNAPHMPVHLGSMGASVKAVIDAFAGNMGPEDAFVLNDPYNGGTHLPDVTVVRPIFLEGGDAPAFYAAARGHHADIGGATPGSMPPASKHINEEGVLLPPVILVKDGAFLEADMRARLGAGPSPARNIDQNIADLRAQLAACAKGAAEVNAAVAHYGAETVAAYMGHIQDNAEESVRRVIDKLPEGDFRVETDAGDIIAVAVTVDRKARTAHIDFTGTSGQSATNLNAPAAVVRAAVLYVFRCLVEADIPMNEGCLRPLHITIPPKSLLSPQPPAAVAGGNVETSQLIVDALFAAVGASAASQGTMNNLTFGDETRQYYETVCGGAGAGPGFDGAHAVHTHMTNSSLTDPEILEQRFPVRVEAFSVRSNSGGAGDFQGGNGVCRILRFLAPFSVSLLAGRRQTMPFGLFGGADGAAGSAHIVRITDGLEEPLDAAASKDVKKGDRLVLKTPGGGGFCAPSAYTEKMSRSS